MINWKKTKKDGPLSKQEKIIIYILCLLNPFLAWFILYHWRKKTLPIKAGKANKISFISLGIVILVVIIGFIWFTFYIKNIANENMYNPSSVISKYEAILEKNPNDINALLNIWSIKYLHSNNTWSNIKTDDAIIYIDKVLSIEPNNPDALLFKVYILLRAGKREEAMTFYKQLESIDPTNEDLSSIKEKLVN